MYIVILCKQRGHSDLLEHSRKTRNEEKFSTLFTEAKNVVAMLEKLKSW